MLKQLLGRMAGPVVAGIEPAAKAGAAAGPAPKSQAQILKPPAGQGQEPQGGPPPAADQSQVAPLPQASTDPTKVSFSQVDQILGKLGKPPTEAQIDAAISALARYASGPLPLKPNKLTPEEAAAVKERLGRPVAEELARVRVPLAYDKGASVRNDVKRLQRALYLADVLDNGGKVKDIGNQKNRFDFDVDGRYGDATRNKLNEFQESADDNPYVGGQELDESSQSALIHCLHPQPETVKIVPDPVPAKPKPAAVKKQPVPPLAPAQPATPPPAADKTPPPENKTPPPEDKAPAVPQELPDAGQVGAYDSEDW